MGVAVGVAVGVPLAGPFGVWVHADSARTQATVHVLSLAVVFGILPPVFGLLTRAWKHDGGSHRMVSHLPCVRPWGEGPLRGK
ncbi:hypothetical protein Pure05_32550 [Paenarthrobacter ureafaciens]|nr:hypothetical protein Pure01_32570 [Paenarthrobacter ureafaciens]GLU65014.1 hypothetical protein Pure02_32640 [Paenarthrobacter ureafaciens]GLU69153.1 hypothetical protein Pure03_31290 [Paenarthrobacter ureafaciens]GLU73412.1 hypothetical protein Pure04_31270 [Paenarthrobacter ureafaciens]GLU77815.1 hypothetical protein Pure05_32550 [Paenarthrobacter ureafaciens]